MCGDDRDIVLDQQGILQLIDQRPARSWEIPEVGDGFDIDVSGIGLAPPLERLHIRLSRFSR